MQLGGVDTNLVVPLLALLRHQSVTRAAREVGLSQSSMSHALARLRAHFADPLLVPAGRALVLTERGKALVESVASAVAALERVFAPPEPFHPRASRRVFHFAATDNLELYVLPYLAATLRAEAPGVELRVSALSDDWPAALERGDVDLKLGRKYAVPGSLESQDLSNERFACVVRRGHPAPARPTLREYADLDHIDVTPAIPPGLEPASRVDALLAKNNLRRRIVMTVPHFLVAAFVVARSDLALTAPSRLLRPFIAALGLRRLTLPLKLGTYTLNLVWAARNRDDEGLRWLRAAIARSLSGGG